MILRCFAIVLLYNLVAVSATLRPEVRWCTSSWASSCVYLLVSFPLHTQQWSLPALNFWQSPNPQRPVSYDGLDLGGNQIMRVLNFFPVPVEEECLSQDKRRRGICMNTYECRIQRGKSNGPCALGFGVCCVFTASCNGVVQNNLTYVISPGFPNLIDWPMNCSVVVQKIDRQVSQLRIDFVHFNIGQPNIRTGVCDEDVMEIRSGRNSSARNMFQICGWNSGQHVYVDVNEDDDTIILDFRLPSNLQARMWEMRVSQLAFEQRAPTDCLQYFQAPNGTLKTLNYLPNGRFLADQDYLICIRQERGMCGISYIPCTSNSFRIGPSRLINVNDTDFGMNGTVNDLGNSTGQGLMGDFNGTNNTEMDVEGSGGMVPSEDDLGAANGTDFGSYVQRRCRDRVLIPCDFEEFITPGNNGAAICNLEHCGDSLCDRNELDAEGNCRVETWATPFRIRVAFGPGQDTGTTLEENVGMCLMYEQLPCVP